MANDVGRGVIALLLSIKNTVEGADKRMCEESKKFQDGMNLYLRSSPIIPPPPDKCIRCESFHTIGGSVTYCKVCHHPPSEEVEERNSGIHAIKREGIAARLWSKVMG